MHTRTIVVVAATCFAYLVTVLQRSSLGVAAVEATARFEVAATVLSILAVAQLVVYAGLQVPVGVLIDRVGPRVPLLLGAAVMVLGQTTLAFAGDIGVAIAARILVGAGDAGTFIAGIRLIAVWVPERSAPFVTQIYGVIGQCGQLLSAIPFLALLQAAGWVPAFLSVAGMSVIAFFAVLGATRSSARSLREDTAANPSLRQTLAPLADALCRPGTWIGFWAHFVMPASQTMFVLLWGYPFLTVAIGLDPAAAAAIISVSVLTGFVAGPILGILSARFPFRRTNLVLAIMVAIVVCWIVVLSWRTTPPVWLLVLLVVVFSVGGPGALIGFDFARTYNPPRQLGSANGVVNTGGFIASLVAMFVIGIVLDVLNPGSEDALQALYSWESFRIAFAWHLPLLALGTAMLLLLRRRLRRKLRDEEGIVVSPLWLALVRRIRRRGSGGAESQ